MRPVKPDVVRDRIHYYVSEFIRAKLECRPGDRGAVQKYLVEAWPDEEVRHRCVGWLLGQGPTRMFTLTDAQVMAFKRWIDAKLVDGKWYPAVGFVQEALWIEWAVAEVQEPPQAETSLLGEIIAEGGTIVETGTDPDFEPPDENIFTCDE